MVRRWSRLIEMNHTSPLFEKNKIRIRKTRNFVKLRYYSLFPTWFLIPKQAFWLLRHENRNLFMFLINWVVFSHRRGELYRFLDSSFSPLKSSSLFWHWRGHQEHFVSSLECELTAGNLNAYCWHQIQRHGWLWSMPSRVFTTGEFQNLPCDEDHELGVTILTNRDLTPIEPDIEIQKLFKNLDNFVFISSRRSVLLLYKIMIYSVLFVTFRNEPNKI